ncbi:MAG: transcriptional regulator [Proteobacteria bacterium]|nr:transcriptional regulator [Pseudomonadota bacterium]
MTVTIKELMIPIDEYVAVGTENTLFEYFQTLEQDRVTKEKGHSHRDALVFDEDGSVMGKITMIDIFLALEPGYKSILDSLTPDSVLTPEYMAKLFKSYNIWNEPLQDLCRKTSNLRIKDIMHVPEENEYVETHQPLTEAFNRYVMGIHQPLLVREAGRVVGVLRYGDVFNTIKELTLACPV